MANNETINRFVARKHLENLGGQVDEAVDGKDWLTKHQQKQYEPDPDGFTDARSRWIPSNGTDQAIGTIIWIKKGGNSSIDGKCSRRGVGKV